MNDHVNITRIKVVYNALEELAPGVIFVGGATVSLYADRPATETRPTDDVDVLVELTHYSAYIEIDEKLRQKGFANDIESGVICRYIIQGITVDVMPTSEQILGFSNRWYAEAFNKAVEYQLGPGYVIRIFSPAYFIATKLEAFKGRGKNDGRTSSDFEDIVFILNNRTEIWQEMASGPASLTQYLRDEFRQLHENRYLDEWVSCHLDYQEQRRVNYIIGGIEQFVENS